MPFILLLCTSKKSLAPSSLHLPIRQLHSAIGSPLPCLFSRLDKPSSCSFSWQACAPAPVILVACYGAHSGTSQVFLVLCAEVQMQFSKCGIASFLGLMASLRLRLPILWSAFIPARLPHRLILHLPSMRTPRSSPAKLFSTQLTPTCTSAWGYSSPGAELCICLC